MTQCSDQWLTTVSSLSWTRLVCISQGGTFPPHACSEGERCLPPPDQKGNRTHVLTGEKSGDRISPEPDLAGTGPEKVAGTESLIFVPPQS
ncbi:hypothetical protein OSB04_015446 [Centaurea solstitialis]|uniref:Uncharacterized protein n=1 Tax=Centaurea solstitialis TaxID=347529 RepID=A0AA38TCF1_9ASTR|nr:hypothetical protein OSB04_015446 [Centaurea solstitialis]